MRKFIQSLSYFILTTPLISLGAVIEPHVIWSKSKINVCFADPSLRNFTGIDSDEMTLFGLPPNLYKWNDEAIEFMKKTVNSSYTEQTTGVTFVGWHTCSGREPLSTLYIFAAYGGLFDGVATLGEHGTKLEFNTSSEKSFKYIKEESPDLYPSLMINFRQNRIKDIKYLILHELGHVAGLRHEHIRIESQNDTNCSKYGSAIIRGSEQLGLSARLATSYDAYSIMNYCYRDYLNLDNNDILG